MKLDIRMPMGLMFLVVGAILVVYGAVTNADPIYAQHSLGFNVNLLWGAVLFVFGVVMVVLAPRAVRGDGKP